MHIRRRLWQDPPDREADVIGQIKRMPVPVYGLVAQRHLEDWDAFEVKQTTRDGALASCDVSISYTLWRNPRYLADPVNLARLDDETLQWLDHDLPSEERAALAATRVPRIRYPLLWEGVTTHWCADPSTDDSVEARLVAHVNEVVAARFAASRVRPGRHGALDSPVDERHVEHDVPVLVGGYRRSGIRIDTDPDVYGLGVALGETSCFTAVVPRDELRFITLAFSTRPI